MKKILLIILLFCGLGFAQTNGKLVGDGVIITDSLYYGTPGDSVWVHDWGLSNNWFRIFLETDTNDPEDSISVELGTIVYTEGGTATDTTWGSYTILKDSAWGTVNIMINDSTVSGRDYFHLGNVVQLMRISLLNHRATLATRSVRFTIQAIKQ